MNARPRFDSGDVAVGRAHAVEMAANQAAQARAVRVVASRSTGVDDCREMLAMLGLSTGAGAPEAFPPAG